MLLIHGLASDAEAMAPVAQALAAEARVIAYDRRGYGASGAPEPYRGTTVEEQAQDAAALLGALDPGPAVVCGDGFGALVALDLAKRHRALVRAAVLPNPPLFMFVPEATERLARPARRARGGGARGRPRGRRRGLAGRPRRTARRSSAPAPRTGPSSPTTRGWRAGRSPAASCARSTLPAVVLTGPWSPPHVVAAADALAGLLPAARRADDGDLVGRRVAQPCSRHPERRGRVAGSVKARRLPVALLAALLALSRCRRARSAAPAPNARVRRDRRAGAGRSSCRCRSRPG